MKINVIRSLVAAAALWAVSAFPVLAQTSPNWTYGYVPTPAQWNAQWASKQDTLGFVPLNTAGGTMTGRLVTAAPGASLAGFNLTPGTAPASPANGDMWVTSAGVFVRVNGVTVGPLIDTAAASGIVVGTTTVTGGSTATNDLFTNNGGVLGRIASVNSGVLVTSGAGVPSVSTTLPNMAHGTPTSITLTNGTGLPIAGLTGLGTGVGTALAVNVGSAGAPVLFNGALGTPSSGTLTSATGLPISTGLTGAGTGILAALAVNVGTAGSPVINGGVLGTPSSGTVTNLTGTASININGTVGATTPTTGAFTTVTASTSVVSPIHGSTGSTTFQSNSTFAGAITTGQQWYMGANVTPAAGPILSLNANTVAAVTTGVGAPTLHLVGANATQPQILISSFSAGANGGTILYAKAAGTAASPTAVQAGDQLGGNFAAGYRTSASNGYSLAAGFVMVATENFTSTASGARVDIYATPTGTTGIVVGASAAAAAGTITNAPTVGNPTKWIPIDDNGTTRYVPAW